MGIGLAMAVRAIPMIGWGRSLPSLLRLALRAAALQLICVLLFVRPGLAEDISLKEMGGVFSLPVRINDTITLDFTVDSGASVVIIPADVASTLMRTGTLAPTDFKGEQQYMLADGTSGRAPVMLLRKLQIGQLAITDVVAAIGPPNGPMLLGQSVLQRLHRWSVDNAKHVFSAEGPISPAPPLKLAPDAEAPPPPNANGDQAQDHHVPRGAYDTGPVVDAHGNGPSRAIGETHDCAEFYPSESRMIDEAGDVLVGYDVAATGVITNVHLVRTSGSERLDQAAIVCVSTRWRNTPAMQGGKPVASPNHQAIIRFSLH